MVGKVTRLAWAQLPEQDGRNSHSRFQGEGGKDMAVFCVSRDVQHTQRGGVSPGEQALVQAPYERSSYQPSDVWVMIITFLIRKRRHM